MTAEQTAINHRALMTAAARAERAGYQGDAFAFVEGLVLAVIADGYRPLPKSPAPRGPGSSEEARAEAKRAAAEAVRAAKERRTTVTKESEQ